MCQSCLCNKSQRLSFGESTLKSHGPLDLIYNNVWEPFSIASVDGFYYYIISLNTYIWFYPLHLKYDVFTIFRKYKAMVENKFKRPIVFVYSDDGGEYTSL